MLWGSKFQTNTPTTGQNIYLKNEHIHIQGGEHVKILQIFLMISDLLRVLYDWFIPLNYGFLRLTILLLL